MYKTSRISGPKHNYLGLSLNTDLPTEVRVRPLIIREDTLFTIDEVKLMAAVSEGVRDGNRHSGRTLFIDYLEYVPTDTPDYKAYTELAKTIIQSASRDFD